MVIYPADDLTPDFLKISIRPTLAGEDDEIDSRTASGGNDQTVMLQPFDRAADYLTKRVVNIGKLAIANAQIEQYRSARKIEYLLQMHM